MKHSQESIAPVSPWYCCVKSFQNCNGIYTNKICLSSWRRKYNKCALNNTSYWCSLMNNKVICGLHLYVWDYFLHSFLCIYYFTKIKPLPCSVPFSSESWEKWLSWLSCALSPKLFTNNSEKRGTIIFFQIPQFSRSHMFMKTESNIADHICPCQ